jgi:hypothetical protein
VQESGDYVIKIDDDHPEALHGYLEFLYTPDIPLHLYDEEWSDAGFHKLLMRTFQIADKHDEPLLLEIIRQKSSLFSEFNCESELLIEAIDLI